MINSQLCCSLTCDRRGQFLPLTEFGIDKSQVSGRNGYCLDCIRKKVARARKGLKAIPRKAYQISHPKDRPPTDMVMEAIRRGAHSRNEIKRVTKLNWDVVVDSLAELRFSQNILITRVVKDERCFYLRAA